MRPLPHLRIIRFPPKKRAALCGAAKEGGRGARLFAMPHGRPPSFPPAFTENHSASLLQRAPPAAPREGFSPSKGKTDPKQRRREKGKVPQKGPCLQKSLLFFGENPSLLWFCRRRPPSRGAVRGPGRAPGLERTNTASAALFFISIGSPWRAGTGRCAAPCAKAAAVFPGPAKARRALPGFSWGAPFGGKSAFGRKKSGSLEKSRIFLFCEKGQQWGTCPPVAIRFSASSR